MSVFAFLALTYLFVSCWFNWRVWCALKGYRLTQVLVCLSIFLLSLLLPFTYKLPTNILPVFLAVWAGALWLAFFLYALMLLLLVDIFRLFNRRFSWFPRLKSGNSPKLPLYTCLSIASLSVLICLGGWINATTPTVRELELTVQAKVKKPETITVAALSDLHLGRMVSAKRLDQLVDLIIPHKPDIVLFAGDVIDDHVALDEEAMKQSIERLQAPLGVWGIPGNHEYISGPIDDSLRILNDMGIKVLRDKWAAPKNKLLLVGRDDITRQRLDKTERIGLDAILSDVSSKKRQLPMILLDHQPYNLEEAEQAGALLQLSGHTHNGQLWPINYIVASLFDVPYGHQQYGDTHYWVSVGAGTWGPPVRTSARPEVVIIKLHLIPQKAQ